MNVYVIIPVKTFTSSKERLADLLTVTERIKLSELMLKDVLSSVSNSKKISKIIVVSKDEHVLSIGKDYGVTFVQEEKELGVNAAVALTDSICKDSDASIVIPHDLPLILPSDIDMLYESAREKRCVIVTPSYRLDGTNALLRKPCDIIGTHYDEDSYEIHVKKAGESKIPLKIVLNKRLMLDLDEPADILPILSVGSGAESINYLCTISRRLPSVG
ncbi:MAG: 2-phospho-L-lactate guanylyltransferase [Nitrososphaerales archaeon]